MSADPVDEHAVCSFSQADAAGVADSSVELLRAEVAAPPGAIVVGGSYDLAGGRPVSSERDRALR